MDEGLNYLQTFNPIESKAELLEKTLIGRKNVVDLLEKLVIESATSGNKHQRLIVGPRGSGKTHLLRVLYNRASSKEELKDKLKIAYLCEDEYGIANFLDFIIRIFRAFIKWDPENSNYLNDEIDQLKKVPLSDKEKVAVKLLLKHINGHTLLIIAENIGNIFNGIEENGQRKLRDLLQQYPYFSIMASNQALFKDIQDEDKPFHNFFKITHLKKLTLDEAILFLKSIAEWEEKTGFLKFLENPKGRGRIHAIYDITGGNHRLLVTFYNFLKVDYKNNLSYSFIKTINDLIPYYQSFMNLLSPQQQKIIQFLCQTRKASIVKDIAENCFSSPNTISKQMSTLERLKYVDAESAGKETYYELSEPLLRICFEVKENRGRPVKLFIDFLGNLYSVQEVKKKYMQYHILSRFLQERESVDFYQEQLYYKETLKQYFPDNLGDFRIDEFEKEEKDCQVKTYIKELEKTEAYPEILQFSSNLPDKDRYLLWKEAIAYEKIGDINKEIETAKLLLEKDEKDIRALLFLARLLQKNEKFKESNEYFNKILDLDERNVKALNGFGKNLLIQEKFKEAEHYFLKVLSIEPDNEYAIKNVGKAIGKQKRYQDAYDYFKKLTVLKPESSEGWHLLGLAQAHLKKIEEAKKSYLTAFELNEKNCSATEHLGILVGNQGDHHQAHKLFKKLTALKPDYSKGWGLLGWIQEKLKKIEEAKASYLKSIELDENNSLAVLSIAEILVKEGSYLEAENYIEQILKKNSEDSIILNTIGEIYRKSNQFEKAIPLYEKAIKVDSKSHPPYFNIVSCIIGFNEIEKALSYFERALNVVKKIELTELTFEENFTTLFIHGLIKNILKYLKEALVLSEKYNYSKQFFNSISQAIFDILIQHEEIELKRFEWIENSLSEVFKEDKSMIVPLKFLNIGIRHLKKKEKNALFQFTKEERNTFQKFVLVKIGSAESQQRVEIKMKFI